MKKKIKMILDSPSTLWISLGAGVLLTLSSLSQGPSIVQIIGIWSVVFLVIIRAYFSPNIFKAILSLYITIYLSAGFILFTSEEGYIIEPFFMSIFLYSSFIAQSYSTKYYQIHLRSRWLWSTVIIIIYNMSRIIALELTRSYISSEIIALTVGVILIILWRAWAVSTNENKPENERIEVRDDKVIIYTSNMLNSSSYKWGMTASSASIDARAYIANKLALAGSEDKDLYIITPGGDNVSSMSVKFRNFIEGEVVLIESSNESYIRTMIE